MKLYHLYLIKRRLFVYVGDLKNSFVFERTKCFYGIDSYGDKTNELIRGTTVRKQKGRQIKKEEETGEEDLSAKGESSMVSRCSVSSTERSPRLSQSRGRKRSRNNNNSTSAYSSNISDTPARRKKRALAGLVRVLFTGFDDENDRLIVLKLGE